MRTIFTYLILCFPFLTSAQSNYKKGVVVKNNGESLKGFIDYREWSNSPKFFSFKTSETTAVRLYPDSVKSFEISDVENYLTFSGKISMNRTELPNIPSFLDTSTVATSVFIKLIANGNNVSLYMNTDELKTRYFIKEKSQNLIELKFYNYLDDNNHEVQKTPYKSQLFSVASRYNKEELITDILNKYPYRVATLIKVVNLINDKQTTTQKSNSTIRFLTGIALNRTDTKFNKDNPFSSAKTPVNYLPKISVGLDLFRNKAVQKLIFRGELSFTAITPKFVRTVTYAGIEGSATYMFNQYTIALTPQIIYNIYNTQNLKVFLDAGLNVNLSTYNTKVSKSDNAYFIPLPQVYKFEPLWSSFPVKAGLALNNKVEFYAAYTYPTSYSNYSQFSLGSQILSVGASFYLNKKQ